MSIVYTNGDHFVEEIVLDASPAEFAWVPRTPEGVSDYGALPGAPTLDTDPDLEIGNVWNGYTLIIKDASGPTDPSNLGWELGDTNQDTLEGAPDNPTEGQAFLDYNWYQVRERLPRRAFYAVRNTSAPEENLRRIDVYSAAEKTAKLNLAKLRCDQLESAVPEPEPQEPPADIFG